MRAGSMPRFQPSRLTDTRALFLLAVVVFLALLAFAVFVLGANGPTPADNSLLAPFRWNPRELEMG